MEKSGFLHKLIASARGIPRPGIWMKLFMLLFLVGVFSASSAVYWGFHHAREALKKEAFNHLVSIRDIKQKQIENYFTERLSNTRILANMPIYIEHLISPSLAENSQGAREDKEELIQYYFKGARGAEGKIMFHDFFLIDKGGNVLHSFAKEEDLGTNLLHGKFKDTALARAFVLGLQGEGISDIEFYAPSEEKISAFFAVSVKDEKGETAGVLASQIFIREIDEIMQERSGLGNTGETYLVGNDLRLRSDSRFFEERTTLKIKVDTEAARNALNGKTGAGWLRDYREAPVLSAYAPLKIHGLNWCLVAEVDAEEVMAPLSRLKLQLLLGAGLFFVLIMGISYYIAKRITAPLISLDGKLRGMAETESYGDTLPIPTKDEIGSLVRSFNAMSLAIRKKTGDLEKANQEMESFIYSISHDLRTPIITVQGMMDLLQKDLGEAITENIRTCLAYMSQSILRMDQLLKDLLEMSRIGRVDALPETVDIRALAENVAEELGVAQNNRNMEFRVQPHIPLGKINKTRLYQILLNLIGNAVKFMPADKKDPAIEIGGAVSTPGFVECFVRDNGAGIAPKNQDKIFRLFERLHGRDIPGTGMGLAFVKKIVESAGGSIRVESEPGKGAAFYFTIPEAKEEIFQI